MRDLVRRVSETLSNSPKKVVVVGDTMLDRWVYGKLDRCQDGCLKFVQGQESVERPGGAANAAESLREWSGVTRSFFGFSTFDRPVKTRYVEESSNKIVFRYDKESVIGEAKYEWLRKRILDLVRQASAVLISDYDKGFLTPEFISKVSKLCKNLGIPCVADCKRDPGVYGGCFLKCNDDYFNKYAVDLREWPTPVVRTFGPDTPDVYDGDRSPDIPELPAVNCVNHVGAGDCFASHLTLGLACGLTLKESATLAHSAGRVYVQFPHNRPPTPGEIEADLASVVG